MSSGGPGLAQNYFVRLLKIFLNIQFFAFSGIQTKHNKMKIFLVKYFTVANILH